MQFNPALVATTVFLLAYFLLIIKAARPIYVTTAAALLLIFTGAITGEQALGAINYNVLGIVGGMMILAELFVRSEAPGFFAGLLVGKVRTATGVLIVISAFTGIVSAFIDNVATVLIVAPIAFSIAKKLKISPVPFLIGIAVSSNLQGMATLIGDATSVILATTADLDFLDFFWLRGKPGIFFAVQLGASASLLVLWLLFRSLNRPANYRGTGLVVTWVPTFLLVAAILALAFSSLIPNRPDYLIAVITIAFGILGLLWNALLGHLEFDWRALDWETLGFLTGVFILVGSLSATGVIETLATYITQLTGGDLLITYLVLVWASVLISAFVDNIPYSLAMLPVAKQIALTIGCSPYLLMFGLMVGTSLGGNITPIGASANVVATGLLRKHGYDVSFADFVKIGLPFTLAAVLAGSAFIWLVWA